MPENEPDPAAIAWVIERYRRFARSEAPGRSAVYERWATAVADRPEIAAAIARVPRDRRQPALVFALARLLGAPERAGIEDWCDWVRSHAAELAAAAETRSLQTNEPLRCAALLPALARVEGPIALLEVGASAGLCLYPDRYSYRLSRPDGRVLALDPRDGPSSVVLECEWGGTGDPPSALPEVVWRGGIDLAPLDPTAVDTRDWLTALVWPGETGRAERIGGALEIAAADPPTLVRADAAHGAIGDLARLAPPDATLVVTTPGVLVHIPRAERAGVIADARAAGRWITIDDLDTHEGWTERPEAGDWPRGRFAVALDGDIVAAADPLGAAVEPRMTSATPAAASAAALDERSARLLRFEEAWPAHTSAKEEAIRGELGLAPARYYQLLGRVLDSADALAANPLLVGRLRRIREARRDRRAHKRG